MRLKNILIVVKDIEKSKAFYNDLFGLRIDYEVENLQQLLKMYNKI